MIALIAYQYPWNTTNTKIYLTKEIVKIENFEILIFWFTVNQFEAISAQWNK